MPAFTPKQIEQISHSDARYLGRILYAQKRIADLVYEPDQNLITAGTWGTHKYRIQIQLEPQGGIDHFFCTCPVSSAQTTACPHVVAVLLHFVPDNAVENPISQPVPLEPVHQSTLSDDKAAFIKYTQATAAAGPRQVVPKTPSRTFIESLLQLSDTTPKEVIRLQVTLVKDPHIAIAPYLELQIGIGRMYVVRKLRELVEAICFQHSLEFGKFFTYHPQKQRFNPQDQPFIDFLLEIYRDERVIYTFRSVFDKTPFELKPSQLKRFLEIAPQMSAVRWSGDARHSAEPLKVVRAVPPLQMAISRETGAFKLGMRLTEEIIPVTPAKDVLFAGDTFYLPPTTALPALTTVLSTLNQHPDLTVTVAEDQTSDFFTTVTPLLQQIGPVTISPEVESQITREPLAFVLWLDRYTTGISLKLQFKYGSAVIDSLGPKTAEPTLLIRDRSGEDAFIQQLYVAGFQVLGEHYILLDEAKIPTFLGEWLPELIVQHEVYRSEAFNHIQIKVLPRFSGAIRLNQTTDLLEVAFDAEGFPRSELTALLTALREKKKFYRMKDGSYLTLDQPESQSAGKLLLQLANTGIDIQKEMFQLPKYRALYLEQAVRQYDASAFVINEEAGQLIDTIKDPQALDAQLPESLQPVLRDYQKTGFKWLKALHYYGFGGILADDMGLGKTLQAIALVMSEYAVSHLPSLVIAPSSLVYNWQEEIRKFAPELSTLILDGAKGHRAGLFHKIARYAFVITSYPLLRRDIEKLTPLKFAFCLLDEAQHIKNPETINAKSVKQINARHKLALTGTPIENSLTELWSIFDFIMPGYLYSHPKFQNRFELPIVRRNDPLALEDLSQHIRPFILRRLKKDVLTELPEKIESKMLCDMLPSQKKAYLAYLEKARTEFESEVQTQGFEKSQIKILSLLTRLRQICCHPGLFLENYHGGSGKLELLQELVRDSISGGHRILIFSQFVTMLDLIEPALQTDAIRFYRIDGQTPPPERLERVNAFNQGDVEVFLISLKAGGTGLNLTGADTVIHYDPWWNPAVEDQATDRAHRIGQEKVVQVFKLVTQGTIEEKIAALQQKKKELIDAVIQPGENFLGKLTLEEIRGLFTD